MKLVDRALQICRAMDIRDRGSGKADTLESIYRRTLPFVPERIREELKGLANAASLGQPNPETCTRPTAALGPTSTGPIP